jgi:hypothetical protein
VAMGYENVSILVPNYKAKAPVLKFRVLLIDGAREVRFERATMS